MIKKIIYIILILTLVLSACSVNPDSPITSEPSYPNTSYPNTSDPNSPVPSDYSPKPEDVNLTRGEAYIDSRQLLTMESYPLQFMLSLKGNLPTPCHQLRVLVSPPDSENKILVEVYSVTDPNKVCTQALSSFEVNVPLGSFQTGYYILLINGEQVAEFQA